MTGGSCGCKGGVFPVDADGHVGAHCAYVGKACVSVVEVVWMVEVV